MMIDIIKKVRVELPEPKVLHSGGMSKVFYDCDLLTPDDLVSVCEEWEQIALWHHIPRIESVISVGGGLRFAGTLARRQHWECGLSQHTLVVDDVTTTGKSLRDLIEQVTWSGGKVVLASVIIQRGEVPKLNVPFFSLYQVDA